MGCACFKHEKFWESNKDREPSYSYYEESSAWDESIDPDRPDSTRNT